jgi:hypothetical protein
MPLNTIPNKGLTSRGYPSDRITTPIIINGDMSVAQRGTSINNTNGAPYLMDRFRNQAVYGSTAPTATIAISQSTTVPTGQGFVKSTKYDVTTAQASLTTDTGYALEQRIEGQNLQMIKKGTSNAEKLTLAFWVRSNKTGTYIAELADMDNSRQCSQAYTISSADTWEKKVLNYPADTTGAYDNDNATSLKLRIWVAAGGTYTSGTLATTWAATSAGNSAVGQVNLVDSTSNEWYITGVQLEVGEFDSTSIPSFPFESFESNLRKCQRYFFKIEDTDETIGGAFAKSASQIIGTLQYPVVMRGAPSATNNSLAIRIDGSDELQTSSSGTFSIENTSDIATTYKMTGFTIGNTDHGFIAKRNSGSVEFSAEL